jgi:hypothetical protein
MTTITQVIAALPTPPSMSDIPNFPARGDAFLAAMQTHAAELEIFRGQANTVAGEVNANAATATTKAAEALASAAASAAAEATAVAAALSAAASWDSFDDRYLGSKAADPVLDNDGNALQTGALYWNTGANEMRAYSGSGWLVAYTPSTPAASQAEQEAGATTAAFVTPGRQQFHPSAAKVWLKCDPAGAIQASYNVTSITDAGTGIVVVTIGTDFSSDEYVILGSTLGNNTYLNVGAANAGAFSATSLNAAGVAADPVSYNFACFGDQA